jgi:cell division protein YceG involved in septum cleavage
MKKRVLFVLLLLIALAVCSFSIMNNLYFSRNISIVIEEGNSPANVVLQLKETNAIPVLNFIPSNVLTKIIGSRIKTGIYTAEKGQHFFELIIKIRHGIAEKCTSKKCL